MPMSGELTVESTEGKTFSGYEIRDNPHCTRWLIDYLVHGRGRIGGNFIWRKRRKPLQGRHVGKHSELSVCATQPRELSYGNLKTSNCVTNSEGPQKRIFLREEGNRDNGPRTSAGRIEAGQPEKMKEYASQNPKDLANPERERPKKC